MYPFGHVTLDSEIKVSDKSAPSMGGRSLASIVAYWSTRSLTDEDGLPLCVLGIHNLFRVGQWCSVAGSIWCRFPRQSCFAAGQFAIVTTHRRQRHDSFLHWAHL